MQEKVNTAPTEVVPQTDSSPISPSEAAAALSNYRWKRDNPEADQAALADTAETEIPVATEETPPTVETAEPEPEDPPIEAPRSWSKEWKEEFATYPREVQEKIAQREQERDTAIRRGQNEAAEHRKAAEAERTQLEQVRKQYEDGLTAILAELQNVQQGQFADIKTQADVQRMAQEDWPRYALWDAHQKQVAAHQQALQANRQQQAQEYQTQWAKFVDEETKAFLETAPELKTSESQNKFANDVRDYYKTIGFTEDEVSKLISGQASVSPHDRRLLTMVRDAISYRNAKAAVPKKLNVPLPKVQRPGTAPARARDSEVQLRALENRFNESGNPRDAAELLMARRSR